MKPDSSRLFEFLCAGYIKRTVRRCWLDHYFTRQELDEVLDTSWQYYRSDIQKVPKQANMGNWMVMNLAVMTVGAQQALVERGFDRSEANEMIYQVTWKVTSRWTLLGKRLTKIFFRKQMKQLYFLMNFIMNTLFSHPAYNFDVKQTHEGFELDVRTCPVAAMMKDLGIPELCVQAWCRVDGGIVELLDAKLARSGTLAMGKEYCDFVFLPGTSPKSN